MPGRPRRWPVDDEGFVACVVCLESVIGAPWVELGAIKACDGVNGWLLREWESNEDAEEDRFCGPILHLGCVGTFLDGLVAETSATLKSIQ